MSVKSWDFTDWVFASFVTISICVLVVPLILLLGVCVIKSTTGLSYEYSNGERTGIVYKISTTGLIWKTWEGEMNLGGVKSGDKNNVANLWEFSVTDPTLVKRLQHAIRTNQHLTLKYTSPFLMSYKVGGSGYLVTAIEEDTLKESNGEK